MSKEMPPLDGLRVVVTRPRAQADSFARALAERGAEPVLCPMIRIAPPIDPAPLRRSSRGLEGYDWVAFTSVNGVAALLEALRDAGRGVADVDWPRVACIGPATAAAARRAGLEPVLVPDAFVAEALLDAFESAGDVNSSGSSKQAEGMEAGDRISGKRFLLPRAAGSRALLREGLEARGARVDEVEAYRAIPDEEGIAELRRRLAGDDVDVVTFTASSTVENCVAAVGTEIGAAVVVAAIGPITADTARRHGLRVDVQAAEYAIPGLVAALCAHYAGSPA